MKQSIEKSVKENRDEKNEDEDDYEDAEAGRNIPRYHAIGLCSLLLLASVLLQPLLIPQGTLFGQLLFLISLSVSSAYNFYISSLGEKIRRDILFEALGHPQMLRFRAGTWTTMALFVCLLLFHGVERSSPEKDRHLRIEILDSCLPDDTVIWRRWKAKVVEQHLNIDDGADMLPTWRKTRKTRRSQSRTERS
ncbi:hypothetical protein JVT61DRAFT_4991 [Boletus reticuloceps]|uniref:Uncharacterized protein n=1 Tax=Boletus reticuloceps TaxID=495285 RepID=A0A8I2YYS7_9AGAM|nr:hypothetical protein JVT61DRAFT_4991 [Boletus reticuloceps]